MGTKRQRGGAGGGVDATQQSTEQALVSLHSRGKDQGAVLQDLRDTEPSGPDQHTTTTFDNTLRQPDADDAAAKRPKHHATADTEVCVFNEWVDGVCVVLCFLSSVSSASSSHTRLSQAKTATTPTDASGQTAFISFDQQLRSAANMF